MRKRDEISRTRRFQIRDVKGNVSLQLDAGDLIVISIPTLWVEERDGEGAYDIDLHSDEQLWLLDSAGSPVFIAIGSKERRTDPPEGLRPCPTARPRS
jgi:hypothetical protein